MLYHERLIKDNFLFLLTILIFFKHWRQFFFSTDSMACSSPKWWLIFLRSIRRVLESFHSQCQLEGLGFCRLLVAWLCRPYCVDIKTTIMIRVQLLEALVNCALLYLIDIRATCLSRKLTATGQFEMAVIVFLKVVLCLPATYFHNKKNDSFLFFDIQSHSAPDGTWYCHSQYYLNLQNNSVGKYFLHRQRNLRGRPRQRYIPGAGRK